MSQMRAQKEGEPSGEPNGFKRTIARRPGRPAVADCIGRQDVVFTNGVFDLMHPRIFATCARRRATR
jgi:bifunctional ADP-heptose synthase (sugar kinase/adenylyltransferase)